MNVKKINEEEASTTGSSMSDAATAELGSESTPKPKTTRRSAVSRPFPRRTLEDAFRIPRAIKEKNGGNPWAPDQVAKAVGLGMSNSFFYLTAASRDFGLTEGTRDTAEISLTDAGRRAVYPPSPEVEAQAQLDAFLSIDLFRRVVNHFGGSKLPEKEFLANTLETTFGLDPRVHDEFVEMFEKNCRFVGIGADYVETGQKPIPPSTRLHGPEGGSKDSLTVAVPKDAAHELVCFVIMPFTERDDIHPVGFFDEVLQSLLTPAIAAAGFVVRTAKRSGSDIIQSTIVTELLDADLVVADLTEHNPNVLFELGMRMAEDKPVALVRAKGTGAIFDVDNLLRVEDYNPNMWQSTVTKDVPRLTSHFAATWSNRDTAQTFLKILRARR